METRFNCPDLSDQEINEITKEINKKYDQDTEKENKVPKAEISFFEQITMDKAKIPFEDLDDKEKIERIWKNSCQIKSTIDQNSEVIMDTVDELKKIKQEMNNIRKLLNDFIIKTNKIYCQELPD